MAKATPSAGASRHGFCLSMGAITAATAVAGFSRGYFIRLANGHLHPAPIAQPHAATSFARMTLFLAQAALAASLASWIG